MSRFGRKRARNIRVVTHRISPKRWTSAPLKIALLADLHLCDPWTPLSVAEAAVDRIIAQSPDIILCLGDYAAHLPFSRAIPEQKVAQVLSRLSAPLGVFNIFGNHDWWDDRGGCRADPPCTKWHRAFDAVGIETIENRWLSFEHAGQQVILAGVASQMALGRMGRNEFHGLDDIGAALDGAPADQFTILMAHEPDIFANLPAQVDLTLSGHTHGGQIRPFGRAIVVPSQYGTRYAYGVVKDNNRHLVVSGGIGYSVLPIRWEMPPEITLVELSG